MSASLLYGRIAARADQISRPTVTNAKEKASLCPGLRSGGLGAESRVSCERVQAGELALAQMHQGLMIARLEIKVRLLIDAAVQDHIQPIAGAHRRDRAPGAVAEHLREFLLTGKV